MKINLFQGICKDLNNLVLQLKVPIFTIITIMNFENFVLNNFFNQITKLKKAIIIIIINL
jgi:hypothetical protein